MSSLQDQVRQDATSLYGFVCSISDKCEHLNRAVTYSQPSERFFSYISELAAATKLYLQKALDSPDKPPNEYLGLRDEIATLRASWGFMHQFVKPVLDADSLKLPTCLLEGLRDRFRQIPQFSSTDFVFYHSAYLNYFNVKLGFFKPRADQISDLVDGPKFPKLLGLIGIPYSQSGSLFINCLIPHEMGHHVFGELRLPQDFRSRIEKRLMELYGASLDTDDRGALVDAMAFWVEELFCDLFAIRLVGFCFSLAFIQLFDTATILDEESKLQKSKAELRFQKYPPDLFRLKSQVAILKADGWWDRLQNKKCDSDYLRTLEASDALTDDDFIFPLSVNTKKVEVKKIFLEIFPLITEALNVVTGEIPNGAELWEATGALIEDCLENGTVPSTLVTSDGADPVFPATVALLNASYRFYLQSLPNLISRIDGAESKVIGDSSYWARRVEMWTAKAIEDVALMGKKKRTPIPRPQEVGAAEDVQSKWRAVLSRDEISKRLRLRVDNRESLVITPLLDSEGFDQDSVDLRLGTHFLMPQVPPEPYVDLAGHERINQTYLQLHAPLGSYFVLPAHQTVLGATLEFVKLPYNVSGEILTKSSIARTFIMIETAPWIHPSYRGCLTLEIANVSNTAIVLYPGTPIGQLVLFHTGVTEEPEKLSGSYLGPIYPEAPNMKALRDLLGRLGLNKYRRPGLGWVDSGRIQEEVLQSFKRMTPLEWSNVTNIINILHESGGFPTDSDIVEFIRGLAFRGT